MREKNGFLCEIIFSIKFDLLSNLPAYPYNFLLTLGVSLKSTTKTMMIEPNRPIVIPLI